MSGKLGKVVGFLTCSAAFNKRNVSSIGIVGLFFGLYVLSGGSISTSFPKYEHGAGLGLPESSAQMSKDERKRVVDEIAHGGMLPDLTESESKNVLGMEPSIDRAKRQSIVHEQGKLFSDDEVEQAHEEEINRDMLIEGADFTNRREQWRLERAEKRPTDRMSILEDRLKIKRRR